MSRERGSRGDVGVMEEVQCEEDGGEVRLWMNQVRRTGEDLKQEVDQNTLRP